jgi:hypothetical protein
MPSLPKALDVASFRKNYTICGMYDVITWHRGEKLAFSCGGEPALLSAHLSGFRPAQLFLPCPYLEREKVGHIRMASSTSASRLPDGRPIKLVIMKRVPTNGDAQRL